VKGVLAYFAEDLSFGTIVFIQIYLGRIAFGAFTVIRYITLFTAAYRFYGFVIVFVTPFKVLHEVTVIPGFYMEY